MWFSEEQTRQFVLGMRLLLQSYELLAREAFVQQRPRWQLKPKHHVLFEIMEEVAITGRNPRSCWEFKYEDMVGRIAKIVGRCHASTVGTRALQRWVLRLKLDF